VGVCETCRLTSPSTRTDKCIRARCALASCAPVKSDVSAQQEMPRLAPLVVAAAALVAAALAWFPRSEPIPATPRPSAPAAPREQHARVAPATLARASQADPGAQVSLPFATHNLYADFQAAVGSSDRRTIEAGLVAWRTCAGYVWLGTGDIEEWVTRVVPEGLPQAEWDRRAQYARASARRCSGFAQQGDLLPIAEELSRKAAELGSPPELLTRALHDYVAASGTSATTAAATPLAVASCNEVKQYARGPAEGVRRITVALRNAARERSSHFLNRVSGPAQNVGINLALCDLDPEGCGIHSNFVGSACIQSGKCGYVNEVDFWKGETSTAVWNGAQGIRETLVQAVKSGDCPALF
jgi:hypothetical protein